MEVFVEHKVSNIVKGIAKITGLGIIALGMMGNEGCKKEELKNGPSRLKMRAEIGKIVSPPLVIPDGSKFDFQFVANSQVQEILFNGGYFAVPYNAPDVSGPLNLSSSDEIMLYSWSSKYGVADPYAMETQDGACLIDYPQVKLGGQILSFEAVSDTGFKIGFGPNGAYSGAGLGVNGELRVAKAALDLQIVAHDPYNTSNNSLLGIGKTTTKQTSTKIGVDVFFGMFNLGFDHYYKSPLSQVTHKGLEFALDDVVTSLKDKNVEWYTRVIRTFDDKAMLIRGGSSMGLKVGDILTVHKELHRWSGSPCLSRYEGGTILDRESPVAIVKIKEVSDGDISLAEFIEHSQYDEAKIGDKVLMKKMIEDQAKK